MLKTHIANYDILQKIGDKDFMSLVVSGDARQLNNIKCEFEIDHTYKKDRLKGLFDQAHYDDARETTMMVVRLGE